MNTIQKKLVPDLRFAEFDGDWKDVKLNAPFDISAGGDIKKEFVRKLKQMIFCIRFMQMQKKNVDYMGIQINIK